MKPCCRTFLACVFLAVLVAAVFHPAARHEFINMDDPFFVMEHHVPQGLTPANIKQAFTMGYGMWMPLTWLSHMADAQLYGLRPAGHHLTNILVHLVNTLLLFLALRWLTGAFYRSLIAAGIFALHPLNVEPVAYIACRKDLLAAFFWLLTVLAYTRYTRGPSAGRYLATGLCFLLGLMAKPTLVTLPLILLLLDYWPLNRLRNEKMRALIREKIPLAVISLIFGCLAIITQQQAEALSTLAAIPSGARAANALIGYLAYLGHLFWPSGLAVFYPWPQSPAAWKVAAAGLALLALTVKSFTSRQEAPYALTGWLWFLIALAPMIGIIPVGSHAMADRYAYIPGIGVFIVVVWGLGDIFRLWHVRRALILFVLAGLLVGLGLVSRRQLGQWKNSETVFRHALAVTSDNFAAHNNLARALMETGRLQEARPHLHQALMIHPCFPQAHNNLGVWMMAADQTQQALTHFARALRFRPDFTEAHYNMANALLRTGSPDNALTHYKEVLRLDPDYHHAADIHHRIGTIMASRRKTDLAIAHFQQALSLAPDHVEVAVGLADLYKSGGQFDQAIDLYQRLLDKRPDCDISLTYNLACLYALKNDPTAAVDWLKKSVAAGFSRFEVLAVDPELDNIRHHPAFQALAEKLRPTDATPYR